MLYFVQSDPPSNKQNKQKYILTEILHTGGKAHTNVRLTAIEHLNLFH